VAHSFESTVAATHAPAKEGEQSRSVITNQQAQELLGWSPKTSLEEGIGQTVDWFVQNTSKANR